MDEISLETDKTLDTVTSELDSVATLPQLDALKSKYVGRQGCLTSRLRELAALPPEQRTLVGKQLNQLKERLFELFNAKENLIKEQAINLSLCADKIDITLPARQRICGHLHPITKIKCLLEDFFICMGFAVVDGPELEDDFHNFTALNIPPYHPARSMHDTFYLQDHDLALRSQTSSVQIRALETMGLPLRVVCPGRVFRRDSDATHSPMFHQMELLMVDRTANFAQLRWLIFEFVKYMFGAEVECRFRPSYFPFTEPSAEVDIKWHNSDGSARWLELGGCGMVHPQVLQHLHISSEEYHGFAFGFGLDRLAMVYYDIDDIRRLYENDMEFLSQF